MLNRDEVEILLKAGHAKTEVARLSGVSLRSVKHFAEERPVEDVENAREHAQRRIGRPSMSRISVPESKIHRRIGMSGRSNVRKLVREYGLHSFTIDVEQLEKSSIQPIPGAKNCSAISASLV